MPFQLHLQKTHRKNVTRSKMHLLAGKDMFLQQARQDEFNGDPNLILQGSVVECPNKNSN